MDKAIIEYKKRRQARLDKKNGVVRKPHYDSVEEYRKRRDERLEIRMDAGVRWVYGVLQENGIDTKGMDVGEAFEALAKLNGGKGGKGKSEGSKGKKEAQEYTKGKDYSKAYESALKKSGKSIGGKESKFTSKEIEAAKKWSNEVGKRSPEDVGHKKSKETTYTSSEEAAKSNEEFLNNLKSKSSKVGKIKKSKHSNHEHDGSGYNGKPGEVSSGRNGNLKPKSEKAKRIDASDAVAETELWKRTNGEKGLEKNSLTGYVDENGNLTPERQKVHDEIIQKLFADIVPQKGKATMTMSGGGPASGKSFIEKDVRKRFGDETCVTVDPDKLKEMLPGYTDMAIKTDKAAGYYHEESSALAKRMYQYALDNNINVVYDGTGDGSVNSVKKKIQAARDAGYAVKGEYVTVDVDGPNGAIARNQARYENGKKKFESGESDIPPRKPNEDHVRSIHAAVSDIIPAVANMFDDWKLWDNNGEVGSPRTLVATCEQGGKVKVEKGQEKLLQKFLDKGKEGYTYSDGEFVKKK